MKCGKAAQAERTASSNARRLPCCSGTAITLADTVKSALGAGVEVPIHSTRTGEVAGIHSFVATGPDDSITLTHESTSRRPFAEGAVRAAEWLSTHTGVYDLRDIFNQL